MKLASSPDIWLRRYKKSATSNSMQLLYGVQSLGPRSNGRRGGGVSRGMSFPCLSQIVPEARKPLINITVWDKSTTESDRLTVDAWVICSGNINSRSHFS
jgi:hypothetical protein